MEPVASTVEPLASKGAIAKTPTTAGSKRGRPTKENKEVRHIDPAFGSEQWIHDPETGKNFP
jgi:hypothetical protein